MLEQATVDRLRQLDGKGQPVLSVFLSLEPGPETLRSIPTRVKDVLAHAGDLADALPRQQRMSLRADIEAVARASFSSDLGRGVAVFKSSAAGIDEYVGLPGPVRDRAIVDHAPYLRPLEAMLDHYRRFAVAVVDARFASIFRFRMDQLEAWEEMRSPVMNEEDFRKQNFGGFSGYEERRVRAHADAVLSRHYQHIATRLGELSSEEPGYDLLIIGGPEVHTAGVTAALAPDVARQLAGTFVIDPHTMTPATVLEHSKAVASEYEAAEEERLVGRLLDTAAARGDAVVGIEDTAAAVNQRAVQTLVVQADKTTPGSICRICGWISSPPQDPCPACGGSVDTTPDIIDALADSVRNAGGGVQHIIVDTRLAEEDVGAFLRFQAATA